jgi:hypothetical protein
MHDGIDGQRQGEPQQRQRVLVEAQRGGRLDRNAAQACEGHAEGAAVTKELLSTAAQSGGTPLLFSSAARGTRHEAAVKVHKSTDYVVPAELCAPLFQTPCD